MDMQIEQILPCRIAYIRRTGAYGLENKYIMEQFKHWADSKALLNETSVLLALVHDSVQTTPPAHCRFDACLMLQKDCSIVDDCVQLGSLSGGLFAVFTLAHTGEALSNAWASLFSTLQNNGLTLDETRPIMERYRGQLLAQHLCELCVPITHA